MVAGLGRSWRAGKRFKDTAEVWVDRSWSEGKHKSKWRLLELVSGQVGPESKKVCGFKLQLVDSRRVLEVSWKFKIMDRGQGKVCGHVEL